eukprot:scaffold3170_cov54-Phaeocystis_antarctica.AAC.5
MAGSRIHTTLRVRPNECGLTLTLALALALTLSRQPARDGSWQRDRRQRDRGLHHGRGEG